MKQESAIQQNKSALQAIAKSSPTAEILMADLAARERGRNFSDIGRQQSTLRRQGQRIVESDAEHFWDLLQANGYGAITKTAKKKYHKFNWNYDLKSIAKAALNLEMSPEEEAAFQKSEPLKSGAPNTSTVSHKKSQVKLGNRPVNIPLRPNFDLRFDIPSNVSTEEIEFICTVLKRFAA